jgi:hypothetical protein
MQEKLGGIFFAEFLMQQFKKDSMKYFERI